MYIAVCLLGYTEKAFWRMRPAKIYELFRAYKQDNGISAGQGPVKVSDILHGRR